MFDIIYIFWYILNIKQTDVYTTQSGKPSRKKKATNRDVARLAGVSVATVSYVINGRDDQHITERTKKKVYQAINFLNYAPNPYAVGLNTKQLQSIVIRSSKDVSTFMEYEILHFMRLFNSECVKSGYQLDYSADKRAVQIAASACICFDMPNEEFHSLGNENYIPVIAVDSLIYDPIFYQITLDYDKLYTAAKRHFGEEQFAYVCIKPLNENIAAKIHSVFPKTLFVSSPDDVRAAINEKNILISQPSLAEVFETVGRTNVFMYGEHLDRRGKIIMDCISKALDRLNVLDEDHYITV